MAAVEGIIAVENGNLVVDRLNSSSLELGDIQQDLLCTHGIGNPRPVSHAYHRVESAVEFRKVSIVVRPFDGRMLIIESDGLGRSSYTRSESSGQ